MRVELNDAYHASIALNKTPSPIIPLVKLVIGDPELAKVIPAPVESGGFVVLALSKCVT